MRTFDTSSSRAHRARAGPGPDGTRSRLPAWGPLAGAYLWAAGYPPPGDTTTDVDMGEKPSSLAQIVLACPGVVNPAARPDPAGGDVDENQAGAELVG